MADTYIGLAAIPVHRVRLWPLASLCTQQNLLPHFVWDPAGPDRTPLILAQVSALRL